MKISKSKLLIVLVFIMLIAVFIPIKSNALQNITVSFETYGGTAIEPVVIDDFTSLAGANAIPADPEKEGYTFMGWYPSEEFNPYERYKDESSFHQIYDEDTTLYALFIQNDKIVKSVNVNVTSPIVGDEIVVDVYVDPDWGAVIETPNITPATTILDKNAPYTVSHSAFAVPEETYSSLFEGTIEEGKDYFVTVSLDIPDSSEYRFANDLQVTANGSSVYRIDNVDLTWTTFLVKVPSTTERPPEDEETTIIVKPAENTDLNNSASEAVEQLVTNIVDGKEVAGVSDELKSKIIQAVDDGKAIVIEVSKSEVNKEEVKEDADKITNKIGESATLCALYDVDVNVSIDGAVVGTITNLGEAVRLTFNKPTDVPEVEDGFKRVWTISSVHDGVAKTYETTDNGDTLSCESSVFSTYAISYEDVKEAGESTSETATETSDTTTGVDVASNPKTGDNIFIWVSIMGVSIIGFIGTSYLTKRK